MATKPDKPLKGSRGGLAADRTAKIPRGDLAADRTSKLSRASLGIDRTSRLQRAEIDGGRAERFLWPAPPYHEFAEAAAGSEPDACLLVFSDGAKASGRLLQFSPDEENLKFQPQSEDTTLTIAFSGLTRLELTQPVALRRQSLPEGVGRRVFDAVAPQPFHIVLAGGERLKGHSVGHVEALCGLFLFLPQDDGRIVRQFIPAQAALERRIGKPLGQILVEERLASADAVDSALQRQNALRNRRVGEYLTDHQIVSPTQLDDALKRQRTQPTQKLGETLVELGYLSDDELEDALAIEQRNRTLPLGQILTDMGVVEPEVIQAVMAKKLGIPFVDLRNFEIAPEILKRITAAAAHRYQVVPLAESDRALVVALANPMDLEKMEELRFIFGTKLIPVMAAEEDLADALRRHYGAAEMLDATVVSGGAKGGGTLPLSRSFDPETPVEQLTAQLSAESAELELNERHAEQNDTTLVRLVNKIILDAVAQRASDIHIESNAEGKGTRIRFRKDGVLVPYIDLPAKFRRAVTSRIKIMSQLDITERRRPQDGKIDFSRYGPARVELRVATIPTSNGLEDVVLRVLSGAKPVAIANLGLHPDTLAAIERLIDRPHGLFLVCGPTGSGKTTTLHSLLGQLNTEERKIWTAEDPIEIAQPGLRQVQVNPKIGWTFAAAMRSFMRADPDVIMVGEMRDAETARIGIEASLTGHLVLSTLHTNSAAESVVRLLDLGMDPFNFADALLGVLSQRLVRRLCARCRTAYTAPDAELEELAREYCASAQDDPRLVLDFWREKYGGAGGALTLHGAKGCEQCNGSGYAGRLGVYELLVADARVKRLVQTRAPIAEVVVAALAGGMRMLKQDGIDKILQGHTDIHQVRTV